MVLDERFKRPPRSRSQDNANHNNHVEPMSTSPDSTNGSVESGHNSHWIRQFQAMLEEKRQQSFSEQQQNKARLDFDMGMNGRGERGENCWGNFCSELVVSVKSENELWPKFSKEKAHYPMVAIESLLFLLCKYFQPGEPKRQETLYLDLCHRLSEYRVIGKTYMIQQLQPHRLKIATFVENVLRCSNEKISLPQIKFPLGLKEQKILTPNRLMPFEIDRYSEDFRDEVLIAKGGFGSVFRATHRLDNVTYAIKKISFLVQSNDYFNKIIREVQLYANLPSNANVVNYKTTWIYYAMSNLSQIEAIHGVDSLTADTDMGSVGVTNPVFNATSYTAYSAAISGREMMQQSPLIEEDEDSSIQFEEISSDGLRSIQIPALQAKISTVQIREITEQTDIIITEEPASEDEDEQRTRRSTFYRPSEDDEETEDGEQSRKLLIQTNRKRNLSAKSEAARSVSDTAIDYGYLANVPSNELVVVEEEPIELKLHATLYIQMELCGQNLKSWLSKRNAKVFDEYRAYRTSKVTDAKVRDMLDFVDLQQALNIFRQIVKGVEFLHSHNLIHRDLKPQNIMFNMDNSKVKIGDFGLATLHDESSIKVDKPLPRINRDLISGDGHTVDVGTTVYASPEQRRTNNYDVKTDMYSLGVILFELVWPLSTAMEKGKCVDKLKSRELPPNLVQKWPILADLILKLTDIRPRVRPTAAEVLRSPIFPTEEQKMQTLTKKVVDLEQLVINLQNRLAEALERNTFLESELQKRDLLLTT